DSRTRTREIRARYHKQICLRDTPRVRKFAPALVRGAVATGSDLYLADGSDLALIFRVVNERLFLKAVEPFLDEARQEFGTELEEKRSEYQGITVESFTTPLREVSLYRAAFDRFVVYANSLAGLRRIIDTYQGRRKALAESPDFQYLRTVYSPADDQSDGFGFLSDAFLRQLMGPATKVKQKRRLE